MNTSSSVKESEIEKYFVRRVEALGGVAEKMKSLSSRGYFDRVAVLPGGRVIFCECKKPKGSRVAVHQKARHERYRVLGCEVVVIKTLADVDRLLTVTETGV